MEKTAISGNSGSKVHSDCLVTLTLKDSGGIQIELNSKVKVQFGDSIKALAKDVLHTFDIKHASLSIKDTGALPFVISARIEAAIKQLMPVETEYLPPFSPRNECKTEKDKPRISRLYLPGNSPAMMINAGIHKPDALILDLEDSVAPPKKQEARFLVRNALRALNFYGAERMVRINQLPTGLDDLDFIVPQKVNLILVPKCEGADQILMVNGKIEQICKEKKIPEYNIWLMPIIESALGCVNAYEIARSAPNVVALTIGLEDYTADIGVKRTVDATESFFARSQLVNAARAAGIQTIDSVFSDVSDMEGLKANVLRSKAMGFDGMGCIHPRQIRVLHENFAPTEDEIIKAKQVMVAFDDANRKGLGVVSLGSKMIDLPVVKRAQQTINRAIAAGKIPNEWRNIHE